MNYCIEENGMNQPLNIQPEQVTSNPPFDQTTPSGDINPTPTTPGLNFPSTNSSINITLDQLATLTLIYIPTNRPNLPTNVNEFAVMFVYPNGSPSDIFPSQIPSTTEATTTTSSPGTASQTSTTPSTSGIVPPSNSSPQVDLPPNFQVPSGTVIMIMITSTDDTASPYEVCTNLEFDIYLQRSDRLLRFTRLLLCDNITVALRTPDIRNTLSSNVRFDDI
jgi:hypothetical protein